MNFEYCECGCHCHEANVGDHFYSIYNDLKGKFYLGIDKNANFYHDISTTTYDSFFKAEEAADQHALIQFKLTAKALGYNIVKK
jgi:hypothetical protein